MSENCGIVEEKCLEIDDEIRTKNVVSSTPSAVQLRDGAAVAVDHDDVLSLGRSYDEKNRSGGPMMDEQRDEPKAPECCAPKKRRTRRGKSKRKHHPYDMKNARKSSSTNKLMKPEAPYNSNQFLLEDHGEIEELDEDLKHVDQISTTSAARTRDSSFSADSDRDREEFYSSPDDEEQFLINDFAAQYESVKGERLQAMTKEELIQEYLALENRVELLSMRLQHNRQQRIASANSGLINVVSQQQQQLLNVSSTMMDDSVVNNGAGCGGGDNNNEKSCDDISNVATTDSSLVEQQNHELATSPNTDNVANSGSVSKSELQKEIDRLVAENEALKRENAVLKSGVATSTKNPDDPDKNNVSDDSEDSETDSDDSCGSSTSSTASSSSTTSSTTSTNSKTSRGSSAKTASSPLLDYSQTNGHSSPIETV